MEDTGLASNIYTETYLEFDSHDVHIAGIHTVRCDRSVYGDVPDVLNRYISVVSKQSRAVIDGIALPELADALQRISHFDLHNHVRTDPLHWARLIGFMNDLCTVIWPSVRFQPFRDSGYVLEKLAPTVQDRTLVFHVMEFQEKKYVPRQIRWNIDRQQFDPEVEIV
jgi:hypothetical protein